MKTTEATGTSLLEQPEARALLADAKVTPKQVEGCARRLDQFLKRYLPSFYRKEQRKNARTVIEGLLSGLERKTAEPIARAQGVPRKPIQFFVGAGKWDDEAVMGELRRAVVERMGDPAAALVLDPSTFPKKGKHSCGVARTWCGRLGKKENCQVGLFLGYATDHGQAPLDRRLYLPKDWAADRGRRAEGHVPRSVRFQERWRMGLKMLEVAGQSVPHRWVVADDEFGRTQAFRAGLRKRKEAYVLDVPCSTLVRDLQARRPPRRPGVKSRLRVVPFRRADEWAAAQPEDRWLEIQVKNGQKGPIRVRAIMTPVRSMLGKRIGPREWLLVLRPVEPEGPVPEVSYHLAWATWEVTLEEALAAHGRRHQIEQLFQHAKGESGLAHYEVRSYVGWHHHMTLSLMALWFMCQERLAQKKNAGSDRAAGAGDIHAAVAEPADDSLAGRQRHNRRVDPQRRSSHLPLARNHWPVPAAAELRGRIGIKRLQ
jgi:SRSO17 transposase